MRTLSINKRLLDFFNGIQRWIISGKKILTTREAAFYLKTDVPTIYRLTQRYDLPCYQTYRHTLYFKRLDIDAWLKPRPRRILPAALKECSSRFPRIGTRVRRNPLGPFYPPQQTSVEENWYVGEGTVRRTRG